MSEETKPAAECLCDGPGPTRGTKCSNPARYWVRKRPLCASHYQMTERRGGRLKALKPRNVAKRAKTCEGPKCDRVSLYVKSGKPLCDAHQKQMDDHGMTWPLGTPRPGKEAA